MADVKHGKTLFVRNLPYSTTNDQLEDIFSNIGPLKSCFVVADKDSGKCRGFGYVKFTILEDAKQALETVKKVNGRPVHLQYANKKEKKKRFGVPKKAPVEESNEDGDPVGAEREQQANKRLRPDANSDGNQRSKFKKGKQPTIIPVKGQQQAPNPRNEGKRARIIVRNLSFKCSSAELKKAFSKYGDVKDIHIPEKGGGKKLGFGFVQFSTKAEAGMALTALNGTEIKGRVVAVDWALPKDKFESKMTEMKKDESVEMDESMEVEEDEQMEEEESDTRQDQGEEESSEEESDEEESDESSEDEEGDSGEESNDSANEKENDEKQKKKVPERESDVNQGRTVFIRNLPFNVGEEDVEEFFHQFGEVNYARTVMDFRTGIPKGCAFVQFASKESADACMNAAHTSEKGDSGLNLGGRQLIVTLAVTRQQAVELAQKKDKKKEQKDTRNLYLAREGMIRPGTEAAKDVPQADLAKRVKIDAAKRSKLKDQNVFVSSVRLCLHNLPATVTDNQLRKVVQKSAGDNKAKLTECRIMRDLNRVNSEGKGKSRGYAFCAFTQHEHALAALRHLNNNPDIFGDKKRPIVEFSLENRKALEAKQKRLEKSKIAQSKVSKKKSSTPKNEAVHKQDHAVSNSSSSGKKNKKKFKNKDSKPLETRKAQDKIARSLHKGPLGLPSHSGAKQRHKPRQNKGEGFAKKSGKNQFEKKGNKNRKEKAFNSKISGKNKRKDTDSFDRLVASYKTKIMKSASF